MRVGRYLVYGPIASGGMATVHFGALMGEAGFSRTVAIKRLRGDKRSRPMLSGLIDEARLVSRISHPNVVPTLDVVWNEGELLVVLEYVAGESLSRLLRRTDELDRTVPLRVAVSIIAGVLHGLHAAHDAKSLRGKPLGIVHRDVSPQNILVGKDGLARVLDFGIATATERLSKSMAGQVKGKLGYVAPEQLKNRADRRTDIYAAAVVLWEMLAGRRLFWGDTSGDVIDKVLGMEVPPPSTHAPEVPAELDALVLRGLARDPDARFESARLFALALEQTSGLEAPSRIGAWVEELAGDTISVRAEQLGMLERDAAGYLKDQRVPELVTELDLATETTTAIARVPSKVSQDITEVDATPRKRGPGLLLAGALAAIAGALVVKAASGPRELVSSHFPAIAVSAPAPSSADAPLETAAPTASASAPRAVATQARPRPECEPPYTVDDRGIRRLKPECL